MFRDWTFGLEIWMRIGLPHGHWKMGGTSMSMKLRAPVSYKTS